VRRRLTAVVLSVGLAGAIGSPGFASASPVSIAKACSDGFTHAVIGGRQKCLHRGEFCAKRYSSQYPRYGFHCRRVGSSYRLT
jgi:hypothetical protein